MSMLFSLSPAVEGADGEATPGASPGRRRGVKRLGWLGFAVLCVFPLFFSLGNHPIHGDSEARYGVVARGMATGQTPLLIPTYFDQPHLTKPPLTYWLMAGSIWLVGDGELALRLPAALSGVGTLAIVFGLAVRLHGPRRAAVATAIVAVTPMFVVVSRLGITDGPLGLFSTAALASGLLAVREGRRRWVVGLWVAVGLALLTKGPAGLLAPAALLMWVGLTRQHTAWRTLRPVTGLAAAALPLVAWGLYAVSQHPEAWSVWKFQTLDRAAGTGDHPEPWWFFVPVLLVGLLPGTALLWSKASQLRGFKTTCVNAIHSRAENVLWALMLFLTFAVFTMISGKLMSYLMPLTAPVAWWAASVLENINIKKENRYKFYGKVWILILAALGPVCFTVITVYFLADGLVASLVWPGGLAWIVGMVLVSRGRLWPTGQVWGGALVFWLTLLLVIGWAQVVEDLVYEKHSVPTLVRQVKQATGLERPQILTVGFAERSLPYYTHRPTARIDPRVLDHVWAEMRKDDLVLLADPQQWDIFAADPNWDLSRRFVQLDLAVTLGYEGKPLRVYRTIPALHEP